MSSRVDISDHEVAMPREGFSVCIGVCILGVTESLASAATALDRTVPEHFRVFHLLPVRPANGNPARCGPGVNMSLYAITAIALFALSNAG